MKKLKLISVIAVLIFTACKKEESYIPEPVTYHTDNKFMKEIHSMMSKRDTMDLSGDPDAHFAKVVRMYNQSAIHMCDIAITKGKDTVLKNMAQSIKVKQSNEITQLNAFLSTHTSQANDGGFNAKMKQAMDKMHNNADAQIINISIDRDFAVLMITHHQSAIEMIDLYLNYGEEKEGSDIAQQMKTDREKEIKALHDWVVKQ